MAGRKTAYRKNYAKQAREACAMGNFTLAQLGRLFGVSKTTVWEWRQKHPEFDAACAGGYNDFALETAHGSLIKLAKGFNYTEVTKEAVKDKKTGDVSMEETKRVRKMVTPNINAIRTVFERVEREQQQQQGGGELADLIADLDGHSRTLAPSELFTESEDASCEA
ncbi:hypothetical protein [Halodesulfovibrio sp.]|jgi:transcriptional regulator with XRE-family HTH domain|uniref:hypothetical protein n=1 Tax=Halodesulfovibrio sp. TaxID=1912772 RepID=UPI0025CDCEDA|nr:hypothetical protein [Halodesulfovibrio sp.]MCT4626982.1 hypothetical protein [Halodesulfovibrio sp.]